MSNHLEKDAVATLKDRWAIMPGQPLVVPAGSHGEARIARSLIGEAGTADPAERLALLGERRHMFRIDVADAAAELSTPYLMRLLDWGIVDWDKAEQRVTLIFEPPAGTSLAQLLEAQPRRLPEADISTIILPPLINVLKDMAAHGVTHGRMRAETIHLEAGGGVTLAECLSMPPSWDQPVSALSMERGLTAPLARGSGTSADDIYALGMLVAQLATGQNAFAGMDERETFRLKVHRGSYAAAVGRHALSKTMTEMLRGMLEDDADERWTAEAVGEWLTGRHSIIRQVAPRNTASRPLMVAEVECWDPRAIADAFAGNQTEALNLIGSGALMNWVRRTLVDQDCGERIADAINMPMGSVRLGSHDSRLVARVVMALHPGGPVRYAGMCIMPDAMGVCLFKALLDGESVQALAEITAGQLAAFWFKMRGETTPTSLAGIFDQARFMLERPAPGAGVERCLYELCRSAPLMGAHSEGRMVIDSRQLLLALEAAAQRTPTVLPLTRHGLAFLFARDPAIGNKLLNRLVTAATDADRALANLHALAHMQKREEIDRLPHLAGWFVGLLQPCIDRLHGRKTREDLRAVLVKAAATGNLKQVAAVIDHPSLYLHDRQAFSAAWRDYGAIQRHMRNLRRESEPGAHGYHAVGREVAALIAGVLSVVVCVGMIAMHVERL